MKNKLILFFATGAYTGYFPFMPGTIGTLWGIPIGYLSSGLSPYLQAAVIAVVFAASVFFASKAVNILREDDPSMVVCDEITGFLISFFLIPFTLFNVILVFILFRFFDILKPYPIGFIDKKVKGGFGVVLDDVAAGIYANICAILILRILG